MSETTKPAVAPLVKTLWVPWKPEAAFERFTAQMASWWPLATHSVGEAETETVILEGRVGGRLYERHRNGSTVTWGTLTAWDPPRRVAFTWHPGREAEGAQDVEVRFEPEADGTRVELTHDGWHRLGEAAEESRAGYDSGWDGVLALYQGD
jgi:hypothetical protein